MIAKHHLQQLGSTDTSREKKSSYVYEFFSNSLKAIFLLFLPIILRAFSMSCVYRNVYRSIVSSPKIRCGVGNSKTC